MSYNKPNGDVSSIHEMGSAHRFRHPILCSCYSGRSIAFPFITSGKLCTPLWVFGFRDTTRPRLISQFPKAAQCNFFAAPLAALAPQQFLLRGEKVRPQIVESDVERCFVPIVDSEYRGGGPRSNFDFKLLIAMGAPPLRRAFVARIRLPNRAGKMHKPADLQVMQMGELKQ
eukprot:SAG11_NODE_498_length_8940_cov_11.447121_3_plen_172_part_00